jgi:hypothetical protein
MIGSEGHTGHVFGLLLCLACSTPSLSGPAPQPIPTGPGFDASVTPPKDAGDDAAVPWKKLGFVWLSQRRNGSDPVDRFLDVRAQFGVSNLATFERCLEFAIGPCAAVTCQQTTMPPLPATLPSAGVIQIVRGDGTKLTLTPSDGSAGPIGVYNGTAFSGRADFVQGDEDIRISAPGKDVPAFDKTLRIERLFELAQLAIPFDAQNIGTVDRNTDLPLAWDATGRSGQVAVLLGDPSKFYRCTYPGQAGAGSIPSAVLKEFAPNARAALQPETSAFADETIGDYRVRFSVTLENARGFAVRVP